MVFGRAPHQKICDYSGNSVYHSGRAFPCLPTGRTAIPCPVPGAIASMDFRFNPSRKSILHFNKNGKDYVDKHLKLKTLSSDSTSTLTLTSTSTLP